MATRRGEGSDPFPSVGSLIGHRTHSSGVNGGRRRNESPHAAKSSCTREHVSLHFLVSVCFPLVSIPSASSSRPPVCCLQNSSSFRVPVHSCAFSVCVGFLFLSGGAFSSRLCVCLPNNSGSPAAAAALHQSDAHGGSLLSHYWDSNSLTSLR